MKNYKKPEQIIKNNKLRTTEIDRYIEQNLANKEN